MTLTMNVLSASQAEVLAAAVQRADRLVLPLPVRLKGIAGANVVKSLLARNLIKDVDDGHGATLVLTDEGLRAVGDTGADQGQAKQEGMDAAPLSRNALTDATEACSGEDFHGNADEDGLEREYDEDEIPGTEGSAIVTAEQAEETLEQDVAAIEATFASSPDAAAILAGERVAEDVREFVVRYLRGVGIDAETAEQAAIRAASALSAKLKRNLRSTGATQSGGKLQTMIDMMRTPEGATVSEMATALDWQQNSVRGAIAGAIKKRLRLDVISEKRQGESRTYRLAAQ